jgi:hypothetical protein
MLAPRDCFQDLQNIPQHDSNRDDAATSSLGTTLSPLQEHGRSPQGRDFVGIGCAMRKIIGEWSTIDLQIKYLKMSQR